MHIVIISHYYPPLNAIASLRPLSFARYFVESGIDVTVLTTQKKASEGSLDLTGFNHPRLKVVEVPYKPLQFWRKSSASVADSSMPVQSSVVSASFLKRALTKMRKRGVAYVGSMVDYQFFWTQSGLKAFSEIHHQQPVDAIISTFSPPASHFIASGVVKKYPLIPWVADYRDLWSGNHVMAAKGLLRGVERLIEQRTIAKANHLTTVSGPLAHDLRVQTNQKIPVSVIYNGFESAVNPQLFKQQHTITKSIRIVYTGTIYPGRRDPSPLLLALNELEREGVITKEDVRVEFYGLNTDNIAKLSKHCNAEKWVDLKGHISYQKSIEVQNEADFLLFLESGEPDARGVLTGKLFEYIITGKTILALGVDHHCASAQVIEETQTGIVFGVDQAKIKEYIKDAWLQKQVPQRFPKLESIAQYSRIAQAKKMLDIVNGLISK